MGNGLTIPGDVKASVAKSLKEEYEKLRETGAEDEEIQEILTKLYTKLTSEAILMSESSSDIAVIAEAVISKKVSSESVQPINRRTSLHNPSNISSPIQSPAHSPAGKDNKSLPSSKRVSPSTAKSTHVNNANPEGQSKNSATYGFHSEPATPKPTNGPASGAATPVNSKFKSPRASMRSTPTHNGSHPPITSPVARGMTRNKSYLDNSLVREKSVVRITVPKSNENEEKNDNQVVEQPAQESNPPNVETLAAMDNWDSVSKQPFCSVCKMAFKSAAFLDRHIKFSEVHQKTLEELGLVESGTNKGGNNSGELSNLPSGATDASGESTKSVRTSFRGLPKPVDGVDYRLIYNGVKFFWRTQENIDFDIYFHIKHEIIEVVPFDPPKSKEFKRLYFNYNSILKLIEDEVQQKVDLQIKELSADRFATIPPRQQLYLEAQQHALVTYLLSRLQKNDNDITFVSSTNGTESSPVIVKLAYNFMPVIVVRRRLTAVEEIKPINMPDMLLVPSTPAPMSPTNGSFPKSAKEVVDFASGLLSSIAKQVSVSPIKASMIKAKEV